MLLEVDRAVAPVGHHDVAALPGHLVIRTNAFASVDTADPQTLAGALTVLSRRPARRLGHVVPLRNHNGFLLEPLAALVPDICHLPSRCNRPVTRRSCLLPAMRLPCRHRPSRSRRPHLPRARGQARPSPTATAHR